MNSKTGKKHLHLSLKIFKMIMGGWGDPDSWKEKGARILSIKSSEGDDQYQCNDAGYQND